MMIPPPEVGHVDRLNTQRLLPPQPGPAGKKPGGGTVFIRDVQLPEAKVEYAGVRVELYAPDDNEFVDHPDAVSWDSDAHSLIINSADTCLAEYVAGVWKSVIMIRVETVVNGTDDAMLRDDAVDTGNDEIMEMMPEQLRERILELEELINTAYDLITSVDHGAGGHDVSGTEQAFTWVQRARQFVAEVQPGKQPVSDDEPSTLAELYQRCRTEAQVLLTHVSPGRATPLTGEWYKKRARWMREWAT